MSKKSGKKSRGMGVFAIELAKEFFTVLVCEINLHSNSTRVAKLLPRLELRKCDVS